MNFGKKFDRRLANSKRPPKQTPDATAFLCDEIPEEVQAEIKPILKGWRNKRTLRNISLEDSFGSSNKDYARTYLTYVLERQGVTEWQESCAAAWALGVVPLDENERKEACRVLRLALHDSALSFKDSSRIILSRTALRTLPFSVSFSALSALVIASRLQSFPNPNYLEIVALVSVFGIYFFSILLLPPIFLFTFASDLKRKLLIQSFSAISLGRLGMPESIGALAKATDHMDERICRASLQALMKVLPAVDAGCFARLPDDAVQQLAKLLIRLTKPGRSMRRIVSEMGAIAEAPNKEVVLAILTALEFVGDSNAIEAARITTKSGRTELVRSKAESLIPILEERRRSETDKKMLLRGAAEPIVLNALLRPASYSTPENSNQLLRASLSESENV